VQKQAITFFWFRRDLRLHDNVGLFNALSKSESVVPLFIFDKNILDKLDNPADLRVNFIHKTLTELSEQLKAMGSGLMVKYGNPSEVWKSLFEQYDISSVYTNHDYEPYAMARDSEIGALFNAKGINFFTFKDHCIFEKSEVLSDAGRPYTVFTPYSKKWKAQLNASHLHDYDTKAYFKHFHSFVSALIPSLKEMGFHSVEFELPEKAVPDKIIEEYAQKRNYPSVKGTSRLGIHLRFGTISIRQLAQKAFEKDETFLNELIWRDFYSQILWHFPHVSERAFKSDYDRIQWRNDEKEFAAWCEGKTGYPIVDAGMRELNATGFMHNRVRMVVASFLSKHLLIDWRWGEAYFAKKLLDFDLASNNGGWQWAAGSGTDASPYFRVFNPKLQTEKFDPQLAYIKKWVPEYLEFNYPRPIVDHEFARKRCLQVYKAALGQ
jgi:deoxyribodipyrimidine photo-lyase